MESTGLGANGDIKSLILSFFSQKVIFILCHDRAELDSLNVSARQATQILTTLLHGYYR